MSFSKIPSIDIRSARPLPERWVRGSPERGPAGRGLLVSAQLAWTWSFRPLSAPHSPSVRACQSSNPVPPLPFLPASAVYSAHAVQVCCTLQPIMGFAWFQARPGPVLWGSSRRSTILPRRPALSPSLETDRRSHVRLSAKVSGRIRRTWTSGQSPRPPEGAHWCQGWSERSTAGIRSLRNFTFESSLRHSHPRRFRRLAKSARCHQSSCFIACRAIPSGATPFEAFPSRTARSGSRVPVLCPLVVTVRGVLLPSPDDG
jgi:hypothetical protein